MEKRIYARIYEKMLLIRFCEEKLEKLFSMGMVHGTTHLYIGEEAVAAGVCCAAAPDDVVVSTHRGHGHCLAKGMEPGQLMAELLGRQTGCCRGRGGSMHLADPGNGCLGTNGIVGGGLPLAAGAALALRMRGERRLVVCFFGDGATNQGAFHEAVNLASVWKLPVLFVCEDNKYGLSMPRSRAMNVDDIAARAASYGIPGKTVDGNDAVAVYREAEKACAYVRQSGPMLLVCDTYRISGHSKSDKNKYRTQQEIAQWKAKDPIARMKEYLQSGALLSRAEAEAIEARAAAAVREAAAFAQRSPFPSADALCDGVYA